DHGSELRNKKNSKSFIHLFRKKSHTCSVNLFIFQGLHVIYSTVNRYVTVLRPGMPLHLIKMFSIKAIDFYPDLSYHVVHLSCALLM
ncbi:TPA: hypothetical protein MIR44_27395, partial [Klebsiella pneumoniae]|nr:hypothetical protein [Klebsiella pneumoniae]